MVSYVEPLEADLWFRRIEIIANGALGSLENALRHASHLLRLTPRPLRPLVGLSTNDDTFEALLDAADLDTAARHLVAQPGSLGIEEGSEVAPVKATIQCSILHRTVRGTGETAAQAILDAWTSWLLAIRAEYGPDLAGMARAYPPQAARICDSVPVRLIIPHR